MTSYFRSAVKSVCKQDLKKIYVLTGSWAYLGIELNKNKKCSKLWLQEEIMLLSKKMFKIKR